MYTIQKKIIMWGATGQAKVLKECTSHDGYELVALFDNNSDLLSPFPGVPIYHGQKGFEEWLDRCLYDPGEVRCLVAIGGSRGHDRLDIQRYLESRGIFPAIALHPSAFVAEGVKIGKGSQILARSTVCVEARMGDSCIVNTGAIVDHGTVLHDGVHVAPGAHITGEVIVGRCSMIGAGSTVLPRVKIGENVIVGAGSVVIKDIESNSVVYGNPARSK